MCCYFPAYEFSTKANDLLFYSLETPLAISNISDIKLKFDNMPMPYVFSYAGLLDEGK